ncbi:hypothetical protein [Streptomyces lomondensis]|uniref:Uncharacterized protein n=1 Tax=Streptomyces lomondensis TaxID=68229 RepID=A0ABQ2XQE4_9ACTN|nr:hypothetical protein [Streptomyces lomondensis]MCF0080823.1 hypothetical protein [Streptomyces lomondensis]GGX29135.1 hypothetical protein GCM10010383_69670 [Streptomyces lomondensis]
MSRRNRREARPPTPQPAPRAPGATVGDRPAAAVAAWAALLLMLLTAVIPAGPRLAPADAVPTGVVGAAPGTGRHADDGCATACVLQAATRHEQHGERPSPPGQFATLADAEATAPRHLARPAASPSPAAFLTDPAPADRGRAPPPPSGI